MIRLLLILVSMLFPVPKGLQAPTTRPHGYVINHTSIEKAKNFTVLISIENFGSVERGTGVLIDSRHVLTCFHVANGSGDIWIYRHGSPHLYHGTRLFGDPGVDLAILELDTPVKCGRYASFEPLVQDGEPITIIGNIMGGMKWFVGYGVISTTYGRYLLTDGLVLGGDSGGPWINDAGKVVALSDFGFIDRKGRPLGVNGGVSAKTIVGFLKEWKSPSLLQLILGG